jgi:ATP-binding cassette, subfamily C (CFTR/MRP), member 4
MKNKLLIDLAFILGSGKTSLLLSIINEIPFTQGEISVSGRVAYVEQDPNIFAGTVRENILFGKPFDSDLFSRVIEASCLERDIESFSAKDLTEIGEKGVTISGGQKARICFARALYSDADIYLLDDPLAAVDSKVSREMFNKGIKGFLKEKTVILVTHQVSNTPGR